jgi:type I restriction enzyme S subunit
VLAGFKQRKLGELVTFKTGKLDSNAAVAGGAYPFFTCSQETLRTDTFSFDTECVLLAGNNANGIFPLKYFHGQFDAYQRTYVIRPVDTGVLDTKYLYYALRIKLEELRSFSTGAATKFLTLTILNETAIQVPSIEVQKRISGLLSAYDELIENSQQRINTLESMARALYHEWFVHFRYPGHESITLDPSTLGDIPEGWEVRKIAEFADFTRGFEPGSNAYKTEPDDGLIKFLRVGDLSKRDSDLFVEEQLVEGRILKPTDIAISLDGSVGIVRIGMNGAYSSGIRRIDVKDPSRLGWVFAYQLLLSDRSQETIHAHAKGTTIKHAGSAVAELDFVSPPATLIAKFEGIAAPIVKQGLILNEHVKNLRAARDLLLPRLLSGQIEVEAINS